MRFLLTGLVTAVGLLAGVADAPAGAHPAGASDVAVSRVAGADRYATAAALHAWVDAAEGWNDDDDSAHFTIVTGDDWPDALAASGLGTVLLVTRDSVPEPTAAYIAASSGGATDVYFTIVGGKSAVSEDAEQALVSLVLDAAPSAKVHVDRFGGANRYETAASLAPTAAAGEAGGIYGVELVSGENFPDAAVAAPLGGAILLTKRDLLPDVTEQTLKENVTATDIIGGTSVISKAVAHRVEEVAMFGRRIAGRNRYETAALVAQEVKSGYPKGPVEVAFIVGGEAWPETIAAAGAADRGNSVVLYTTSTCVPKVTRDSVKSIAPEQIVIVGGSSVAYYGSQTC